MDSSTSKECKEANSTNNNDGGGGGVPGILEWAGPHSVVIPRTEAGFGFTLRHFVVHPPQSVLDDSKSENEFELTGLSATQAAARFGSEGRLDPQAFRLESQDTIFVKSVKAGSPAHSAGLNTGDRIVAVNGDSVTGKSYAQVIALIQESTKTLKLLVVPKDEDILQMAYQSEVVGDSVFASNSSLQEPAADSFQQQSNLSKDRQPYPHPSQQQHKPHPAIKQRSASCEQELVQHRPYHSQSPSRTTTASRKIPTLHQIQKQKAASSSHDLSSTSSSSLSSLPPSSSSPSAKMSIASNIPSKTKYSFGLYFPPKTTAQNSVGGNSVSINSSRTISAESLGIEDSTPLSSRTAEASGMHRRSSDSKYRKSSLDETSFKGQSTSSTRSRDYFIRYSSDKSNSDAVRNNSKYSSRHSTHEKSGSEKPVYIITRSQTVSSISPTGGPSSSSSSYARRSGDFSKTSRRRGEDLECKSELTRQVRNVSSASSLADGKSKNMSDIHVSSYSREANNGALSQNLPTARVTSTTTTVSSSANSNSGGGGGTKTFVVRIPCDQQQQPVVTISQGREVSNNQTPTRQSYGTAFALKRAPTATHIEIQKAIGKPIVSQRKSQFESSKVESSYQPVTRITHQNNRYKMEIDRIRTQPKFSSFASRKASFEQSPDRDYDDDGKEMTPTGSIDSANQSPKPIVKIRRISTDSNSSGTPPPSLLPGYRERSCIVPSGSASPTTAVTSVESSPICILVTPGSSNNSNSSNTNNSNNSKKSQQDLLPQHSSSLSSSSPSSSMMVSVISGDRQQAVKTSSNYNTTSVATGETTILTRNNLSVTSFQDDPTSLSSLHHQRHHSSPSPSSLSTGTMGDSGVWVKSYHSSNDMLDSSLSSSPNPLGSSMSTGGGGVGGNMVVAAVTAATTTTTNSGVFVTDSSSSRDYIDGHHHQVFPRQRHKSYMEAMNSPRDSAAISQHHQQQQPFPHRGVHTQSPQQMLAQSQALPHVPSTASSSISPSPSSTSSSSPTPNPTSAPSNTRSPTVYPVVPPSSKEAKLIIQTGGGGSRTPSLSPLPQFKNIVNQPQDTVSSNNVPPHHPHHHHPQQQQQQHYRQQQMQHHPHHPQLQQYSSSVFPGSSSTHSLGSIIGEDPTQPFGMTGMSTSDSAVSLCGPGSSNDISKSSSSLSVTMRKKAQESQEDQANKLHRRTSYLMATAKDRTNTVPIEQAFGSQEDSSSVDKQQQQQSGPVRTPSSVKLNKFFGEQIPSIAESQESKSVDDEECTPPPTPPPEIIRKGPLSCKIAVMEGKKCSDRTWKPVYTILRQTEMYVAKDPNSSGSSHFESQVIPLKSCMVEFARDYAKKKKNVFRLTTHQECEYLFQAEDRGTMLCWIQAIKSINEPEKAEKMDEMIAHEHAKHPPVAVEVQVVPSNKLSPPLGHMAKKLSGLSLRHKLTASPNMRRKKSNASEKDKEKPEKDESAKKSWKGRIPMMKNLKKHSEDSLAPPSLDVDPSVDCCKQFGMPMEDCFPSPYNEYVPLIVELCTRIVETRGLEVIGVYRVPGNSAAVNALVEEFNRGIDYVNIDNEKLLDINVISSLLKSFFRKLPEPLVNAESYDGFIEANRNPDGVKRMLKLKRLLHLLPTHHNETFKHMAEHLNKVASYGNINKMDAKNLAIMFGPTLIRKSEDDTVSLVTDMSDQCRIIESIILHHEWFFSQWDQDSHIPMETRVETVLPDEGHGTKDDDEEADSAISTKEIISSIVGAASRKLRDQQQKSEDSLDSACGLFSPNISSQEGRSFYQETKSAIEEASASSRLVSLSSSKSHNSLASSHGSSQRLAGDYLSANVTSSEPDFLDLEFADAGSPATSSSISRHYSDESLLEKNDELEISHGLGTSMSRQSIHNTLKRIGNDVKTLLHTFEQKQLLEMERRRKEQEMIEHEHLRTQLELEQEDSHSVDDWLAMRGGAGVISTQMPDLVSSSYIGESYPYSQQQQCVGPYSHADDRKGGGGYRPSSGHFYGPTFHLHQGSLDSANSRTSFDNSYEDLLSSVSHQIRRDTHSPQFSSTSQYSGAQPQRTAGGATSSNQPSSSTAYIKPKNVHLAVEKQHLRPSSFRLSTGKRHGSLDSLIDLIDKRSSWASTDSEDGSDLLTSLTTTFDQKLQILVNPKYKLTGTGGRKHFGSDLVKPATIVSDMKETALWRSSGGGDSPQGKQLSPPQQPTDLMGGPATLNAFLSSVLDSDQPFRDPSLHRSSKPEAKIGIASRFERSDNRALSSSPVMSVSDSGQQQQRSPRKTPLPDFGAFLSRHNGQSSLRDGVPAISLTQPKKLDDNAIYVLRSLNKRNDSSRSISKSEKTEMNSNLARLSREEKGLLSLGGASEEGDRQENKENKRKRRSERKQGHRRHTVGGTQDFEHIDALVQVCCSSGDVEGEVGNEGSKMSAWDQLQPMVKDSTASDHRNLQSWLLKERTRGSTPDLSIGE